MKICDKTALKSVERTHAKKFESIRDGLIEKEKKIRIGWFVVLLLNRVNKPISI